MTFKVNDLSEVKNYINGFIKDNGYAPSIRDIAEHFSVSVSTAHNYVQRLKEKGQIYVNANTDRGIATQESNKFIDKTVRIPIVGRIACGQPLTAIENIEEFITLSESLVGTGEFFILRAYGNSMIEAGIHEGDYVIIRQQNTAEVGEIIVALLEDEATLKRFYPEPEKNRIRLHPENPTMSDIYVNNCNIQGVAIKVIKDA